MRMRTSESGERVLERRDEVEVEREAPVAAVVHEDRVRAERRRRHAVRVRPFRLSARLYSHAHERYSLVL